MRLIVLTLLLATNIFQSASAQPKKAKQNIYFAVDSNASYLYSYRKLKNITKSDLADTFNKTCLTLHYRPTFYRYRDSACLIKKAQFLKRKIHILSYNEFINFICGVKYDVQLELNYNIYFIENESDKKYLIYKVLRVTPVVENY